MAEQKKEEFLDEVEESELDQDELIDIDAEAAELEKLDEVTAERDDSVSYTHLTLPTNREV